MTLQQQILNYLKHLAVVAGLAALNVVLIVVLQQAGTLNVSHLPVEYQAVVYVFLPGLVIAGQKLQQQIATELAQQQAAKAMAEAATAKNETIAAQAETATAKAALVEEKNHPTDLG